MPDDMDARASKIIATALADQRTVGRFPDYVARQAAGPFVGALLESFALTALIDCVEATSAVVSPQPVGRRSACRRPARRAAPPSIEHPYENLLCFLSAPPGLTCEPTCAACSGSM